MANFNKVFALESQLPYSITEAQQKIASTEKLVRHLERERQNDRLREHWEKIDAQIAAKQAQLEYLCDGLADDEMTAKRLTALRADESRLTEELRDAARDKDDIHFELNLIERERREIAEPRELQAEIDARLEQIDTEREALARDIQDYAPGSSERLALEERDDELHIERAELVNPWRAKIEELTNSIEDDERAKKYWENMKNKKLGDGADENIERIQRDIDTKMDRREEIQGKLTERNKLVELREEQAREYQRRQGNTNAVGASDTLMSDLYNYDAVGMELRNVNVQLNQAREIDKARELERGQSIDDDIKGGADDAAAELLRERGADETIENNAGETPEELRERIAQDVQRQIAVEATSNPIDASLTLRKLGEYTPEQADELAHGFRQTVSGEHIDRYEHGFAVEGTDNYVRAVRGASQYAHGETPAEREAGRCEYFGAVAEIAEYRAHNTLDAGEERPEPREMSHPDATEGTQLEAALDAANGEQRMQWYTACDEDKQFGPTTPEQREAMKKTAEYCRETVEQSREQEQSQEQEHVAGREGRGIEL